MCEIKHLTVVLVIFGNVWLGSPSTTEQPCPNDSQLGPSGDCDCLPCPPQSCQSDRTLHIVREASKRPGQCCPLYNCTENVNRSCRTGRGATYLDRQTWRVNCTEYRCDNGVIFDVEIKGCADANNDAAGYVKACFLPNGVVHQNGDKWAQDNCTNCTCVDGKKKCVAHFCETVTKVITLKPTCKPLYDCNIHCPYGLKTDNDCIQCKCALNPKLQDLMRFKNITDNDLELIAKYYVGEYPTSYTVNVTNTTEDKDTKNNDNCESVFAFICVVTVFLFIACSVLIWLLIRQCRLRHTKMEINKSQERSKYIHVPTFDTNLNATNKFRNSDFVLSGKNLN